MEDRGIKLRLSVPVRRITLQIALDANVVKDLRGFICRVLSVVNAMNSTAHDCCATAAAARDSLPLPPLRRISWLRRPRRDSSGWLQEIG
jgi:hypothetical protein